MTIEIEDPFLLEKIRKLALLRGLSDEDAVSLAVRNKLAELDDASAAQTSGFNTKAKP